MVLLLVSYFLLFCKLRILLKNSWEFYKLNFRLFFNILKYISLKIFRGCMSYYLEGVMFDYVLSSFLSFSFTVIHRHTFIPTYMHACIHGRAYACMEELMEVCIKVLTKWIVGERERERERERENQEYLRIVENIIFFFCSVTSK